MAVTSTAQQQHRTTAMHQCTYMKAGINVQPTYILQQQNLAEGTVDHIFMDQISCAQMYSLQGTNDHPSYTPANKVLGNAWLLYLPLFGRLALLFETFLHTGLLELCCLGC